MDEAQLYGADPLVEECLKLDTIHNHVARGDSIDLTLSEARFKDNAARRGYW